MSTREVPNASRTDGDEPRRLQWTAPVTNVVRHTTSDFDLVGRRRRRFVRELQELRRELDANLGADDFAHLQQVERWGRACTASVSSRRGSRPTAQRGRARARSQHPLGDHASRRAPRLRPRARRPRSLHEQGVRARAAPAARLARLGHAPKPGSTSTTSCTTRTPARARTRI